MTIALTHTAFVLIKQSDASPDHQQHFIHIHLLEMRLCCFSALCELNEEKYFSATDWRRSHTDWRHSMPRTFVPVSAQMNGDDFTEQGSAAIKVQAQMTRISSSLPPTTTGATLQRAAHDLRCAERVEFFLSLPATLQFHQQGFGSPLARLCAFLPSPTRPSPSTLALPWPRTTAAPAPACC